MFFLNRDDADDEAIELFRNATSRPRGLATATA